MQEFNLGVLFILGLGVFGGTMGAWFFQRIRVPQVVGYIVIGLIIGQSGFQWVTSAEIEHLRPFNLFALGIIGFLVGGELQMATFRKYARQFVAVLLGEGLSAFVLVGISSAIIAWFVIGSFPLAVALGAVFGAIASATDPASTIDVLWESRSRGILTTSITAIVALDDALAMTLYGLGSSLAGLLTTGSGGFLPAMGHLAIELGGAIVLGVLVALFLSLLLRWLHQPEKLMAISIGLLLLTISLASHLKLDIILVAMMLGFTLVNVSPRRSIELFQLMRSFSTPIYVLFFVLVGANLGVSHMPAWLWLLVGVYVVGRSAGKMGGAWLGARIAGSDKSVCNYLGMGIFAQGGVAVGLSIMASQHLGDIQVSDGMTLGDVVIFTVAATTMIVQLLGPPLTKLAITLAGEVGKNVTEDDVIRSLTVRDVMMQDMTPLQENAPLRHVFNIFSQSEYSVYPVVNAQGEAIGTISLEGLKDVLVDQGAWEWLLASDVMQPLQERTQPEKPLQEVMEEMRDLHLEELPVVDSQTPPAPLGMLTQSHLRKCIRQKLLEQQQSVATA